MKELSYISSLVQKAKKQDILAMRTLYEAFAKEMMATSQRITNHKADAEDILQEAFVISFQKLDQLKDGAKYGGWLKQIVINQSLNFVKRKRNYSSLDQVQEFAEAKEEESPFQGIDFSKIKEAMHQLPDGCREIFSLHLLEGYKHREIAEVLKISNSTSKSQYRYAIKLLREKLIPIYE